MAQNREPPAYQEYAASLMARNEYRVLSLAERGLLMTMRLECWVNRSLPADPHTLAKVLGYDSAETKSALMALAPFFVIENGLYVCPELEDYRAHLKAIHDKKAEGGRKGAAQTNGKWKQPEKFPPQQNGSASGNSRLSRGSLVKSSQVQPSKTQPLERDDLVSDSWVMDYDRASNGG